MVYSVIFEEDLGLAAYIPSIYFCKRTGVTTVLLHKKDISIFIFVSPIMSLILFEFYYTKAG